MYKRHVDRFSIGFPPRLFTVNSVDDGFEVNFFFYKKDDLNKITWQIIKTWNISVPKRKGSCREYCFEIIPLVGIRRTTAERLSSNWSLAPHVTEGIEVDAPFAFVVRVNGYLAAALIDGGHAMTALVDVGAVIRRRGQLEGPVSVTVHAEGRVRLQQLDVADADSEGNRMPVILSPQAIGQWLDPEIQEPGHVLPLVRPCPSEWLSAYEISPLVNSPMQKTADVLRPTASSPYQRTLAY